MGARGLLKFLRTHPQARGRFFSLGRVRSADAPPPGSSKTVIVCDFFAVIIWLLGWFHEAKVKHKDYPQHSYVYGADYDDYSERIIGFVNAVRFGGAEPLFFVDGPRCSNAEQRELKLRTWQARQWAVEALIERFRQYCAYDSKNSAIEQTWTMKCLLRQQIMQALQKHGVQVVVCNGEADRPMAEYAREHPEVCGILSNDTDLTMMAGCATLHCKFFDRDDAIKLRSPVMNEKPRDILCEKIEPGRLAMCLEISPQCLPALSILCGNDYSSYYSQQEDVRRILKFTYPFVESAACWIRGKRCSTADEFLSNPEIKQITTLYPEYQDAVKSTYSFYQDSAHDTSAEEGPRSALGELLIPLIFQGKLIAELLSILNCGVYWRSPIVQFEPATCVHAKLLPVRKLLYSLVCLDLVSEYGQFVERRGVTLVKVTPLPPTILPRIRDTLTPQQRMLALYAALTQDPDFVTNPERLCDAAIAPTIEDPLKQLFDFPPLLIYACLVAAAKTGVASPDSLDPLILTCLCTSIGERSSKLMLRPDCRSVTCASQFTSVLEHAYILSSLFNLHDELPLPSELFKVPMYVSFHMVGLGESRYRGPDGQLQEMYRNLIGALPMAPLKDVVTCGGMKGIAPFHDMFASSQTILYELLHPSSTRDAKATHSAVASKPKKKNITSKPKKKSAHAGFQ